MWCSYTVLILRIYLCTFVCVLHMLLYPTGTFVHLNLKMEQAGWISTRCGWELRESKAGSYELREGEDARAGCDGGIYLIWREGPPWLKMFICENPSLDIMRKSYANKWLIKQSGYIFLHCWWVCLPYDLFWCIENHNLMFFILFTF